MIAEVTVQYVNPPRGRARSGSIKGTDGAYYGIDWPGMQNDFQPGSTYKVEYEQNGQFRNVKSAKLVTEEAAPAPSPSAVRRADVSPDTARRMFVGACMHGYGNTPNLTSQMVADKIAVLEEGYDMHYNRPSQRTKSAPKHDDMNDEIPY